MVWANLLPGPVVLGWELATALNLHMAGQLDKDAWNRRGRMLRNLGVFANKKSLLPITGLGESIGLNSGCVIAATRCAAGLQGSNICAWLSEAHILWSYLAGSSPSPHRLSMLFSPVPILCWWAFQPDELPPRYHIRGLRLASIPHLLSFKVRVGS